MVPLKRLFKPHVILNLSKGTSRRCIASNTNVNKIEKVTSYNYYETRNKLEYNLPIRQVNGLLNLSMNFEDYDLISKVHVLIKAKKIVPDEGTLEAMMSQYTCRHDLQSANEVLDFSKPHKLRKTPKMLSIMAEAYFGKGNLKKGDDFLQKITCYTSEAYVVVLKYKLRNAEHAEMIINEMKIKKIEIRKEHYKGMIYGYARLGMVADAKQVIKQVIENTPIWKTDLYGSLIEGLATQNGISQAVALYINITANDDHTTSTAILSLIMNITKPSHAERFPELLEKLEHDPSWHKACIVIANYYLHQQDISKVCEYLFMLLESWKQPLWKVIQALNEIFYNATQKENKAKQLPSLLGLELKCGLEERMQNNPHFYLARGVLDFIFSRLFMDEDWSELENFQKEYERANYVPDIQNQLCKYKFYLASGNHKVAKQTRKKFQPSHKDSLLLKEEFENHYETV